MSAFSEFFLMKPDDVKRYAAEVLHRFDPDEETTCTEIGDGNINYVFRVRSLRDGRSVIVKQADKRLRSSGRPLDIYRSRIEAQALQLESRLAPDYIPEVYHYDETMAALSMEDISAYRNLRKELLAGRIYGHLAENISTFLAQSLLPTTAASGIGKACAERMAQEGYGVVVADVNLPAAEELAAKLAAEGLSAIAVHMDVADEQEVEAGFDKMMETYGSCDLVMSNAGVQIVHPFEEYPFADWRKMMAIHADGAFLVSRAAYRRMKASGKGGRIVFTGSVQSFVGSKLKEPYNFAKHGVAGLAKAIAREGAEYGIYTYTICPSFIKTPLVEKQIPEQAASLGITEEEVVKNIMLRDTVDGVFTTVEDVANTLVFLSKDQGALTGQSLRLTHGWAMM